MGLLLLPHELAEMLCKKRDVLRQDNWRLLLLHHDNAPAHNALSIRQLLAERNIAVLPPCLA